MKKRQSIKLNEEAIQKLLPFAQKYSFSGAINTIILRYDLLMLESIPDFSAQEWMVIFSSINGIRVTATMTVSSAKLAEAIRCNCQENYAQKMHIDVDMLVDVVKPLAPSQTSAVFWLFDKYCMQFNHKPYDLTEFKIFLSMLKSNSL